MGNITLTLLPGPPCPYALQTTAAVKKRSRVTQRGSATLLRDTINRDPCGLIKFNLGMTEWALYPLSTRQTLRMEPLKGPCYTGR